MRLLAIVICLLLERIVNFTPVPRCYTWFHGYLALLEKYLGKTFLWRSWFALASALLPIIIIIALLQWLFVGWVYGLISLLFATVILFYCLGPNDLQTQATRYFEAQTQGEVEVIKETAQNIIGRHLPDDPAGVDRTVVETVLTKSNEQLFAVLFWFIIFGAVGAVCYRAIVLFRESAHHHKLSEFANAAEFLQAVFDWVPVRVIAICYALVGDFVSGMAVWKKYAWSGFTNNANMLLESGVASLRLDDDHSAQFGDNAVTNAVQLIDNTLMLMLAVYFLVTFFAWVF